MKIVTYANRIAYILSINRPASNSNVNVWERDFRENQFQAIAYAPYVTMQLRHQIIDAIGLGKPIFPFDFHSSIILQLRRSNSYNANLCPNHH